MQGKVAWNVLSLCSKLARRNIPVSHEYVPFPAKRKYLPYRLLDFQMGKRNKVLKKGILGGLSKPAEKALGRKNALLLKMKADLERNEQLLEAQFTVNF